MATNDTDHVTLVPAWFLRGYLWTSTIGGVAANLLLICTILRSSRRWRKDRLYGDVMVLLLHVAVADIGLATTVAPVEVWVLRSGEGWWDLAAGYCPVFMGLEVALGLAAVYLLVVLGLHAITVGRAQTGRSCVRVPVALVWLLAASLSVPVFLLAEIVLPRPGQPLCTVLETSVLLHALLGVFRVVVPTLVLLATTTTTVLKLCAPTPRDATRAVKTHVLRISLLLSVSYLLLSLPRSILSAVNFLLPKEAAGPDAFRKPPLADVATSPSATLAVSMMHFSLPCIRPILCFLGHRHIQAALAVCCCPTSRQDRPR